MQSPISTHLTIEVEQEEDGRWIAEVLEIPGVLVYSSTQHLYECLFTFALFGDEIGSKMLARIAKKTGLKPEDL
jgi:hypothetical protein